MPTLQAEAPLPGQHAAMVHELQQKLEGLRGMVTKSYCLANLALQNLGQPAGLLRRLRAAGTPLPNMLPLPFMLVKAEEHMEVFVDPCDRELRVVNIDFIGCVLARDKEEGGRGAPPVWEGKDECQHANWWGS